MSYRASISTDTAELSSDLKELQFALSRLRWVARSMGLDANQAKMMSQIMQAISAIRMVQMLMAGYGAARAVNFVAGRIGLRGVGRAYSTIRHLSRLEGGQ